MIQEDVLLKWREGGQRVWPDYIWRPIVPCGETRDHLEEDELRGVTSNVKIFDEVISGSSDPDSAIGGMALGGPDNTQGGPRMSVRPRWKLTESPKEGERR